MAVARYGSASHDEVEATGKRPKRPPNADPRNDFFDVGGTAVNLLLDLNGPCV
jgi:hypothetical protein